MSPERYRFGGEVVASDVPLPSLPIAVGPPDVRIQLADPDPFRASARWDHHWRRPDGEVSLSCARDEGGYRLGVPRRATFSIDRAGTVVRCRPEGDLPPETLEHLLVDQVLPRVTTLRGRLTLHAGAVADSAGAVAFLGESGAGKSTLCAACVRRGATLVGDDGIVIRPTGSGGSEIVPTYPGLRLFPEPAARLLAAIDGPRVAHDTAKRRVRFAPADRLFEPGAWPLRAVYLLDPDGRLDGPSIEDMPARERFMALAAATLHLHLDDPGAARDLFEAVSRLVASVPVRRLRYPRRYEALPEVVRTLFALPRVSSERCPSFPTSPSTSRPSNGG